MNLDATKTTAINDVVDSALNVTTISDEPNITEVLLYRNWTVLEGVGYLVGIFDFDENEGCESLTTLSNQTYSEKDNNDIYYAFLEKYDRLHRIWRNSHKKETYSKNHFIEWALRDKKICDVPWLADGVKKGFVSITMGSNVNAKLFNEEIGEMEKSTLLVMIAALCRMAKVDISEISKTSQLIADTTIDLSAPIGKTTVRRHLEAIKDAIERRKK